MLEAHEYGDNIAAVYDRIYPQMPDADHTARFIHDLAPQGRVLELGVGTGRVALPMVKLGLRVHGVDASEEMLKLLAERDPEGQVRVTRGDFTKELPQGPFDVGLVPLNTLFMVGREKQIETLRLLASRLASTGVVVVETYNPWYYHRLTEPRVDVHHNLGPDRLMIDTTYVDRVDQSLVIVHTVVDGGSPRKIVEFSRYAWSSELELMARLAGLRLRERFSGWNREAVTPESLRFISVFELDGADG